MTDKLSLLTIHQLEGFLDVWRLTLQYFSPHIHLLEIATALEIVAQKIRREEATKAMEELPPD
jgi:hypothetical protein